MRCCSAGSNSSPPLSARPPSRAGGVGCRVWVRRVAAGAVLHNYVGTEHLLLGILRDRQGAVARILADRGLTLAAVRESVQALLNEFLRARQ
ncbi:Clp protease N-terminal domain-containing protein [Actinopolymorpha alba]|uniref:Clp protease N-terminal domain-containing protein n=1 Tax=Actinopolymorpha alba TaxID=533267 RepID=UPI0009FE20A6|nr:Clp protease N-terminal domain-containing protein [Actinopolymorpha alba]